MIKIKKAIIFLMTVAVCCMAVACGSANTSENITEAIDEGIQLTVDNFEDYVDISAYIGPGDHIDKYFFEGKTEGYLYKDLNCKISFTGNPNYEFKDVVVEVLFKHDAPLITRSFTSTKSVSIKLNLAGNGSGTATLKTPVPEKIYIDEPDVFALYSQSGISSVLSYSGYEITKVSGVATKN